MFDHENVRRTKVSYKKNNKKQHGYFKHSLRDLFRLDKLSMVQKKSSFPMFLNLEQEKIARGNTYYKSGTKKDIRKSCSKSNSIFQQYVHNFQSLTGFGPL